MTTHALPSAIKAARTALADFDQAGPSTVLQTVPPLALTLRELLDVLTRSPGTVTDAEAEAGAWALLNRGMDIADRHPSKQVFDDAKADARAVLEAASEARQ